MDFLRAHLSILDLRMPLSEYSIPVLDLVERDVDMVAREREDNTRAKIYGFGFGVSGGAATSIEETNSEAPEMN